MNLCPTVSEEQLAAIECNRCGMCCESFFLPPLATMASYVPWAFHVCGDQCGGEADDHSEWRRFGSWLLDIEPADGPFHGDGQRYRCTRYQSEIGCTRYDERPNICSKFPYGQPQYGHPGCSWYVRIEGA